MLMNVSILWWKRLLNKVLDILKKYKYIISLVVLYIIFTMHMQKICLYADDYAVINSLRDFKSLDNVIFTFYFNVWSGRLIGHSIVTFGLGFFGINFFRILNPIFLFLFCFNLSKIININNKYNFFKIMFFVSIIILGLDISIVRELLYWADATILYFWIYVPMLIIIYFLLDYYIKKVKFSNLRFIFCILFIIIINFSMESTAVLIFSFILLCTINDIINKKINWKILFLLFLSTIMLIMSYYIPGNLNRLNSQDPIFSYSNIFEKFCIKLPDFFLFLFQTKIFSIIFICSIIISYFLYKRTKTIFKIYSFYLIISNIICMIIFVYNPKCIDFYSANIYIYFFCFLYLILNIIGVIINITNDNKYYSYILLSSISASLVSVILVEYTSSRFFFLLIIFFIVYIIYNYLIMNEKFKVLILILFLISIKWYFFPLIFIYFSISKISLNKIHILKNILLSIFILINLYNFVNCIYYYSKNFETFEYNEKILYNEAKTKDKIIYLKRLKYPEYAYQMPEDWQYIYDWYRDYYYVSDKKIVWTD